MGLCAGGLYEEVLISGATQVLMKRWNSLRGAYTQVGGLSGREIRYPKGLWLANY